VIIGSRTRDDSWSIRARNSVYDIDDDAFVVSIG